jgi:hypothetical protein
MFSSALTGILTSAVGGSVIVSILKKIFGIQDIAAQIATFVVNFGGYLIIALHQNTDLRTALVQATLAWLAAHGVYHTAGKATKSIVKTT